MFYIVQKSKTNEDDSLYKSEVVHVEEDERFNHFHGICKLWNVLNMSQL